MPCVIRIVELAGYTDRPITAQAPHGYLKTWDVDARDGRGTIETTPRRAEAHRFASHAQAWEAWRAQSTVRPLRLDGKPNRPLTAFTVTIEEVLR